jgi:hypothetical protein
MYRKLLLIPLICFCFFATSVFNSAQAINPKAKVMFSTGAYGLVGGALLGASTLAFGTNGRAVAQGASIGLWVGMLFGGYVILSHSMAKSKDQQSDTPYGGDDPYADPYGGGERSGETPEVDGAGNPLERWNPYQAMSEFQSESSWANRLPQQPVYKSKFYMNVLNFSF